MIIFSEYIEYLEESAYAPLYHGTTVPRLYNILDEGKLNTGFRSTSHWPTKGGSQVSLTRNFEFAKHWPIAVDNTSNWSVMEFDRQKLRNNYKIVPFNFFDDKTRYSHSERNQYGIDMNQYEEVVTRPIQNPLKYVDKIYMAPRLDGRVQPAFGSLWDTIADRVFFTERRIK